MRVRATASAVLLSVLAIIPATAQTLPLRVVGSTTVNPVVVEAAEILRATQKLAITVDTQGGSSGGITALAEGRADLAMSSRPLTPEDRQRFPRVRFQPIRLGTDALALAVSKDVWQSGVRALTKAQIRAIYEGKITNWKEVGGKDQKIVFFDKEPGRGTWEVFAQWLYGDSKKAPLVGHLEVGSNEEGRTKVAGSKGAITQLSLSWIDNKTIFPLAIRNEEGKDLVPSVAAAVDGSYPLARPLLLISNGPTSASAKALIGLLLGPKGAEILKKHGFAPVVIGAK